MNTGLKIQSNDIDTLFETFPNDIANTYGVTDSKFTDTQNRFKKSGRPMKEVIGKTIPTSAGTYIGGRNATDAFKSEGQPIDVALKGCRPIGIPIARLEVGTHYVNRVNGQTWLSSLPDSATGTQLEYNPKYLHAELLGGGGGGGGSSAFYASAGGGGGGYCYISVEIPENSYLQFVVGEKGNGGSNNSKGVDGSASKIVSADGTEICAAAGGIGGGTNNDAGGMYGAATGGAVNINGGQGGLKHAKGEDVPQTIVTLDKPENTTWLRGGTLGGAPTDNSSGGGGAASAFSAGAMADTDKTPASAGYGGGGAGAGYRAIASPGGDGGEGLINLYY